METHNHTLPDMCKHTLVYTRTHGTRQRNTRTHKYTHPGPTQTETHTYIHRQPKETDTQAYTLTHTHSFACSHQTRDKLTSPTDLDTPPHQTHTHTGIYTLITLRDKRTHAWGHTHKPRHTHTRLQICAHIANPYAHTLSKHTDTQETHPQALTHTCNAQPLCPYVDGHTHTHTHTAQTNPRQPRA